MNNQRPQLNTCEMWMNTVSVCWFEDVAEHKSLSESHQEQWWTCCVANLTRWTCKPRTFFLIQQSNMTMWQMQPTGAVRRRSGEKLGSFSGKRAGMLLQEQLTSALQRRAVRANHGNTNNVDFQLFSEAVSSKKRAFDLKSIQASLLWEHNPPLVFPSLLYIIKWPTACTLQQTIEPALFFPLQIYWFMLYHPQAAWPCSPVQLQWSCANQYGSDANSVLHVISAQNKVRHARLETLPRMETALQMAPSVAAGNNDSVQKMPTFKELWYSFRREIIYNLNQKP